MFCVKYTTPHLPAQSLLFPRADVYPWLQVQVNDPAGVLVHAESDPQPCVLAVHSLMSKMKLMM